MLFAIFYDSHLASKMQTKMKFKKIIAVCLPLKIRGNLPHWILLREFDIITKVMRSVVNKL